MKLALHDQQKIWSAAACYLCGKCPALGIDRQDSRQGYVSTNVQPCCSSCNYAKKDMPLEELLMHLRYADLHTRGKEMEGDGIAVMTTCTGMVINPVAMVDADDNIILTACSGNRASRCFPTGLSWKIIDATTHWAHVGDPATCLCHMRSRHNPL